MGDIVLPTKEQEQETLRMPDLIGLHYKNACKVLSSKGLHAGEITYQTGAREKNIILGQKIAPGQEINQGTKVDLELSSPNPISNLPSLYQNSDLFNADFLKRYLWIFQHMFNTITDTLDNVHEYFDPMTAPENFLQWLASWFSMNINMTLPPDRLRLLVKDAISLYQWRGTKVGLEKYLEILTGIKPTIIEHYSPVDEFIVSDLELVDRAIINEKTSDYDFTVHFPVFANHFDHAIIKQIDEIIKAEKPAHTNYYIAFKVKEKEDNEAYVIGKDTAIDSDIII